MCSMAPGPVKRIDAEHPLCALSYEREHDPRERQLDAQQPRSARARQQ